MAFLTSTIIGAIGLGVAAVGTGAGIVGSNKAAAASADAEKARQTQMELDATRQKRQIIRQSMVASSVAQSNATAQGAQGGSGLQGGLSQISGQQASNLNYVNNSQQVGNRLFADNARIASAQGLQSFGQGLSGFGGMLLNNQEMFGREARYYGI